MIHPMLGEVAPAVPLLVPLAEIACLFVVLGILFMLRKFLEALLGGIAHLIPSLPLIGNPAADLVHRAEQAVSSALGSAEAAVDKRIGAAEHQLANLANWLWREFKSHANLLYLLAALVGGQHFAGQLRHAVAKFTHRANVLEKQIAHAFHRAEVLAKQAAHGIGADVLPRIKSLDRRVGRVIHRDIPAIRSGVNTAEGEITNLWKWTKDHTLVAGTAAFTAAVAYALSRLGLGGLRCGALRNLLGKRGCGAWSGLDSLLGLFEAAFIVSAVCDVVPMLETAVSDLAVPVVETLTVAGAGLCTGSIGPPPALSGPGIGTIPDYLG